MNWNFMTTAALATLVIVLGGQGALAQAPGGDPSAGAAGGAGGGAAAAPAGGASAGGGGGFSGASSAGASAGAGGASADSLFGLKEADSPQVVSLEDAMRLAVENNFDLRIAKERVVQGEANVRRAWASLLPQVSLAGQYTFNYPEQRATLGSAEASQQQALLYSNLANIVEQTGQLNADPQARAEAAESAEQLRGVATQLENAKAQEIVINPAHVLGANLNVTLPIFNGRAIPLLQNAYEAVDLTKLSNNQVGMALAHSVARAYYSVVTAEKLIAIAEQQKSNSIKHRDATRSRVELGVTTPLNLQRAELDVLRAEQNVRATRNTFGIAIGALGSLIDAKETFLVSPPDVMPAVELEAEPDQLISRALDARQDLRVQKAALAIADRNRLDAWMQFLPTVGLTAQGRWTSNTAGFVNQPFTGAIILSASVPIYDGGSRYASLKESGSKIREELLRVRQLESRIEGQVRGNVSDISVKRESLLAAQQAVELSKKAHENAQNLYELGMATSLDVIDANLSVFLSEVDLARSELDLEQARLSLRYILGELPTTDATPRTLGDDEADKARERMDAVSGG